jgi:hypothetical protein
MLYVTLTEPSLFVGGGVRGYWHCGHSWPTVPGSGDSEDDCGEADGKWIGTGNRSSRRKPAPAPLLSITKPHMIRPGFEPGLPRWEEPSFCAVLSVTRWMTDGLHATKRLFGSGSFTIFHLPPCVLCDPPSFH